MGTERKESPLAETSRARDLTTAECWSLLENGDIGRLAVTRTDGTPDIFPVNFVAHEGAVYIRSAPDAKVVSLDAQPAAAFEIDGHDDDGTWSVVVRGTAARTVDDVEIDGSGIRRIVTVSPRHKPHVLKLAARTVTGRRFTDPVPVPSPGDEHGISFPSRPRFLRPEPIPSHRPWSEGVSLEPSEESREASDPPSA